MILTCPTSFATSVQLLQALGAVTLRLIDRQAGGAQSFKGPDVACVAIASATAEQLVEPSPDAAGIQSAAANAGGSGGGSRNVELRPQ